MPFAGIGPDRLARGEPHDPAAWQNGLALSPIGAKADGNPRSKMKPGNGVAHASTRDRVHDLQLPV